MLIAPGWAQWITRWRPWEDPQRCGGGPAYRANQARGPRIYDAGRMT